MSLTLRAWERRFREAARKDRLASLRKHLVRLGLPNKPKLLLEGTVRFVRACCSYMQLDGFPFQPFLELQEYHASEAPKAQYSFTLDLCGKGFARVLTPRDTTLIDLGDLYEHPWNCYRVCGFHWVWISRLDGQHLARSELQQLERRVTRDVRTDYPETEVQLWFDHGSPKGSLLVCAQDCEGVEGPSLLRFFRLSKALHKERELLHQVSAGAKVMQPVRAISIRQPYAEMILRGIKDEEYRSIPTNIRERVYVYASLKPADAPDDWETLDKTPGDLPTGVIVGTVEIVGCIWIKRHECYAYKLQKPRRIKPHLMPINQPQPVFWRPRFKKAAGPTTKKAK